MTAVELGATRLADDVTGRIGSAAADGWKRRLDEAATLLLLDQFEEASYRYYVLVHDPSAAGRPELREAVFYLGESQLLGGSPRGAKPWFESLAKDGFALRYGRESTVRLVEIASALGDDEAVEAAYERFVAAAPAGTAVEPTVAYAIAKALWKKDPARADAIFARFHPDGVRGRQAIYFRGVIALRRGDLETAKMHFAALVEMPADPANLERRLVADQALLALARIRFETGDPKGAADTYRRIPEGSLFRSDALFEQARADLAAGRAKNALDSLDLFLVAYPVHDLTPKVRLLRGRVLIAVARDDEARDAFEQVAGDYEPVRSRLAKVLDTPTDDDSFAERLGLEDGERGLQRALPAAAVANAMETGAMRRAIRFAAEDKRQDATLADTRALARLVADGLEIVQLAGLPESNDRRARAYDLDRRAQAARFTLLRRAAGRPVLSSAAATIPAKEPEVEAALAQAAASLDALPLARDTRLRAAGEERTKLGVIRERARDLRREIESARARAVALAKYIRDTGAKSRDADEQAQAAAAAAGEIRDLEEKAAAVDRLFRELDLREALTRAVRLSPAEVKAAAELEDALVALSAQLERRLQPEERAALARLDSARASIAASLDAVSAEESSRLSFARTVLTEESAAVGEEGAILAQLRPRISASAAVLARTGLQQVRAGYERLLLETDLGLLDVAWTMKLRETKKVDALVDDRARALDSVERRYAPLLEESPR